MENFYLCPFAVHATNLDAIEKYDEDIIDTKNITNKKISKENYKICILIGNT